MPDHGKLATIFTPFSQPVIEPRTVVFLAQNGRNGLKSEADWAKVQFAWFFLLAIREEFRLRPIPTSEPTSAAAKVAKRAGVSISTVSRVLNAHPSVSDRTAASVRQAMAELRFQPTRRPRMPRPQTGTARQTRLAFVVFGSSDASPAPSFQRLLFGVSKGADESGANLTFHYVDASASAEKLLETRADGMLLGGVRPDDAVAERIKHIPSVWLMGNRTRPTWGDQVMPDNTGIGTLAGQYLMRRGHRHVAYVGVGGWSWSFGIRAIAFRQTCRDRGGVVHDLIADFATSNRDYWGADVLKATAAMMDQFLALPQRPTGIFVSEDRLLAVVQRALLDRQIAIVDPQLPPDRPRPAGSVEIISCNNDARYLPLPGPVPPSIDIGAEAIGRRGVEHLLWRIANRERPERLRVMIGPTLAEPTGT